MNRKFQFLFFLLSFLLINGNVLLAQQYWMEQGGGITIDEAADISIDGSGNSYATGYFTSTANFGTFSLNSSGVTDVYLVKLNSLGIYQWAVKAGGGGSDRPTSIKTDGAGNSYITGFFYGSATFGTFSLTSAGVQDVFVAKYNNAGVCVWANSAGGSMSDIGNGITVDATGNVIITGEFAGSATFGSTTITSMNSSVDVFISKLDASGNFVWTKTGEAPQTDRGFDVATDATGNIYVTGQCTDTITFDVVHNNNMYNAIFLIKYNASGTEQWFRLIGGAGANIANAIATDNAGNPIIAGDFQVGSLSFFLAPTTTTLSNAYTNKIFAAKYDPSGNLTWSAASGSNSDITAKNLAIDGSNNPFVIGNFKCKFNDYADQYGQGTFNSVGYWDIYVSKWNSSGAWQWARQVGGHKDDYGTGITLNSTGDPIFTGSFNQDIIIPTRNTFLGYNTTPSTYCTPVYCSDNFYGTYALYTTSGNSDVVISKTIDPLRQPYDFYNRSGSGCSRPQIDVAINSGATTFLDTVEYCQSGILIVNPQTCPTIAPDYTYLWSTSSTSPNITVSAGGIYSITVTSVDGCFVRTDSIFVIINAGPPDPTISDDVIINTNSTNPLPIDLCLPDTVVLTGGNFGGLPYTWTGPGFPGVPVQTITVTASGTYCFAVTDTNGCMNSTCIIVTFYPQLPPFDPHLICLSDTDMNDTISMCQNTCFQMLIYDSISNPTAIPVCLPTSVPYTAISTWTITPLVPNTPVCNAIHNFCPWATGTYTINVTLIRVNICDTDTFYLTKILYVVVNPSPSATIAITGNLWLCPGDSNLLVGSGCSNTTWAGPGVTGNTNDSVWVSQAGSYSVSCTVTNSFGCTTSATAFVFVQLKPQPTVTMNPSSGLICPNDSVQLLCSGTGTFQWQGPSGPIGGNANPIYVNQPGNYYCILTDVDNCVLVSNTVVVLQYNTPYLQASPFSTICVGDTAVISVVTNPGSTIQWQPPLSGSSPSQSITSPGTYSCIVVSCGITTTASVTINISIPVAVISATGPLTFCDGDSVILSGNSGMASYVWYPGPVSGQTCSAFLPGVYTLTITDPFGCTATDTISVSVYPNTALPPITSSDTTVCYGESVILTASGSGNIVWYSNPGTTTIVATGNVFSIPAVNSNTTYYVVNLDSGCRSTEIPVNVFVNDCDGISIPNVFSPNGDGLNDFLFFTIANSKCFECKIFNRWGSLIYEWNDVQKGWDGRINQTGLPASDGVYYYILHYCNYQDKEFTKVGFFELMR